MVKWFERNKVLSKQEIIKQGNDMYGCLIFSLALFLFAVIINSMSLMILFSVFVIVCVIELSRTKMYYQLSLMLKK